MPGASLNERSRALTRRIAALDGAEERSAERLDAVALGLVDAVLAADEEALQAALSELRAARARGDGDGRLVGWLDAATSVTSWALERSASGADVAPGTRAWSFLEALDAPAPMGSAALRQLLETDETQVSRTGRQLLEAGLVSRTRVGRNAYWELTPRGRGALGREARHDSVPPAHSFWMEALRRGFEGAAGDVPGERRRVDPTLERIVVSTLELHTAKGIRATTRSDIASRAGVPVETVESLFPTIDDMVKTCGQHVFSSLRLPPPKRAPAVFEGAGSRAERVRRLVDTLFDAYEREGASLERALSERAALPVLDESMSALDAAIDALVAAALEARSPAAPTVAPVRALTDLAVWRALRDQGASPAESAELAAAAVERWLAGRAPAAA